MTLPRQPTATGDRLDALLRNHPISIAEPTSAEWESRLEQTMQRVRAMPTPSSPMNGHARGEQRGLDSDVEDVLRTPLPVEAGEPEPSDPYAFDAEQGATYDLLRAPLKSGEHAPLRLTAHGVGNTYDTNALPAGDARPTAIRRRLFFISAAVGTLAAAAAVITLRQPAPDPLIGPISQTQGQATRVEPARPGESSPPTPNVTVAALPQAEALPLEAKPGAATDQAVVLQSVANQQRNRGAATPPAAAADKATPAPKEPELVPAAGPSNLMDHPSTGAVSAALSHRLPEAQRCLPPNVRTTGVRLVFQSNGAVQNVEILNPALDANARACLSQSLGAVRVEPFARGQFDVNATISKPMTKNTANGN